jgi:hypothetical protein
MGDENGKPFAGTSVIASGDIASGDEFCFLRLYIGGPPL